MGPFNNKNRTFAVSGAVGKYLRVKLVAGVLALAGATDYELGATDATAFANDTSLAVRLRTAEGTNILTANGAITAGNDVFAAASGKVSASGTVKIGTALTTTTADGDHIEVLRSGAPSSDFTNVVPQTADYTVLVADSGTTFTTVGAAGTVTFALPAAVLGLKYKFRVGAAQALHIDPNGTETIALPSTGVQGAAGKYLTCSTDGPTVAIECTKAGQWSVFGFTGTWTAEP